MGLKESGLRGSLRSVSTGIGIPDGEIYLHDDWGDNKLQNRDDSATTTYNGVEGVFRPEWAEAGDNNLASVSENRLELTTDDAIITDINLNLDETIEWVWSGLDLSNQGTSLGDAFFMSAFSEGSSYSDRIDNGYHVRFRTSSSTELEFSLVESGDDTFLIESSVSPGSNEEIRLVREPDGTWEIFYNGSFEGSVTDTTFTDASHITFGVKDGGDASLDELKVS